MCNICWIGDSNQVNKALLQRDNFYKADSMTMGKQWAKITVNGGDFVKKRVGNTRIL